MSELFPELDGALRDDRDVADAVEAEASGAARRSDDGRGRGVVAGVAALRSFAAAFGFGAALVRVRLTDSPKIECTVELTPGATEVFLIAPPGQEAALRLPGFVIQLHGDAPSWALRAHLRRIAARYRGATFDQLASRVLPDADDVHALRWDNPSSLFYSYASGKAWRAFFEEGELYRGVCEHFSGDIVHISHEELECNFNSVCIPGSTVSFFNSVAVRDRRREGSDTIRLSTDLQDLDVIRGGDRKLDAALESIAALEHKPSMVVVTSTCVPIVTGDDLDGSATRARARLKLPVHFLGNENNPQDALLERLIAAGGRGDVARAPGQINLLGFPELPGRAELISLLERAGVTVGCALLPDVDHADLPRFGAAALQVVYPWSRYDAPIERLLAAYPDIPALRPRPPFGLAASRAWLLEIAGALGREAAMEQVWTERCDHASLESRWQALRRRAGGYRLGFICDDVEWRASLSARRCMGAPLLDAIREMGFGGVDVLVYTGLRRAADPEDRWITLRPYQSRAELVARVTASPAVAFYSEMYFDRRLTRCGKNIFSLRDLACGPEGAVATLTRLLARCQLPFYRRYAGYLGRPFAEEDEA
ncbi:MAG: hypothetical protein KC636_16585 [Myxococcales bacterium]|nr:hypothetical protein [Myxococcales bacterium]